MFKSDNLFLGDEKIISCPKKKQIKHPTWKISILNIDIGSNGQKFELLEPIFCKKRQNKIGLVNKVLKDIKLVLNEHEWPP